MYLFIPFKDRLRVPYLCEKYKECNENNFIQYPLQHRFDVDSLIAKGKSLSAEELDDLAEFLQAWLVFGLIRRILGPSGLSLQLDDAVGVPEVEDESLDAHEDGEDSEEQQLIVDTAYLSLYMLYWIAKESHINDPERSDRLWVHHAATFSQINTIVNKLIVWRRDFYPLEDESPVLDSVILSIVLLAEYLLDVCKRLFTINTWNVEWELDNALRARLLRAGWCPGEVGPSVNSRELLNQWLGRRLTEQDDPLNELIYRERI